MPTATWRRTTSATALQMTAAAACASFTSLRSRANSTSVTAWLRGRLPTCVVRIRSIRPLIFFSASAKSSPIGVVAVVVPRKPALELLVRIRAPVAGDRRDVRRIDREFQGEAVRVNDVHRTAVTMLENIGLRRLDSGLLDARLDRRLRRLIHRQRDVVKR